ncbi:MAG: hypothetical protein HY764_01850 [Candidatus Portnoybacteria bacterium]|nr:hypothetical protein [Candidatus Portnoybacteria bacterium]
MPEDILAKTAKPAASHHQKFSAIGVILVIMLAIVLILLGERFNFDLNRWINPVIESQGEYGGYNNNDIYTLGSSKAMSLERSTLAPGVYVQYPTKERGTYLAYKLLIHAGFIIPVFLLVFLLYYIVKIKEQKQGWQAAIYAYMVFAFWMMIHLLGEAGKYVISEYKSAAIYIILGALVIIFTPLAIFLQKKHSEKSA